MLTLLVKRVRSIFPEGRGTCQNVPMVLVISLPLSVRRPIEQDVVFADLMFPLLYRILSTRRAVLTQACFMP